MIRIAIYNSRIEEAQHLFNILCAIVRRVKLKCELTFSADIDKITVKLGEAMNCYDIIFLDANDNNSLLLAAKIRQKNIFASIVFTGKTDYDIQSLLKYRPTAYIGDLSDTRKIYDVFKFSCNEQRNLRPYFTVKNKDMLMRISFSDICYFESRKRIVALYTKKQVIEFYSKLSDVMQLIPQDSFVRCHQSYIVNMSEVTEIDKTARCFRIASGASIEISKSYYTQAVSEYEKFVSVD